MIFSNKSTFFPAMILIIATTVMFTACDSTSTGPTLSDPEGSQLTVHIIKDIPADTADTGKITYYSLRDSSVVNASDSASTKWDIAFSGTTIYVNSGTSGPGEAGAVILDQSFDATVKAPPEGYHVDTDTLLAILANSDKGWYHYTGMQEPQHAILPLQDKTLVVKTAAGSHYAKLEILSYYKGNPDTSTDAFIDADTRASDRFYTIKYVIQTNGSTDLK